MDCRDVLGSGYKISSELYGLIQGYGGCAETATTL